MIIVKAEQSHLHQVTNLAMQLWPDNIESELRADFAEILDSSTDIVYLANAEELSIGFIHMSLRHDYVEGSDSSPVGYIEGIYVDPAFRHRGISTRLLAAGEEWSRSMGCSQIASDTELDNYGSQKLHKKLGFEEANRIVAFIKNLS
ncbi:aminoglycoside 6'-N-acetyltransferase [Paenibacillus dauci]|uniref:aminoglycoside 6'-N-acetyltransferase n=1 Tax=Paenibacillus dauci TaxID=1567106 RepID=UPI00061940E2|nr:aminoglycoside 6'-N-acetyltransferase [Paenibacillus dauci]